MALDIYCGSLSRYYRQEWQNVIERWAKENHLDYHINRQRQQNDEEEMSDAQLQETVLAWQKNLQDFLKRQQNLTLSWREDEDAPYTSARPDWTAYWLVILWALYQEQQETPFDEVPAGFQIDQDRVFERHSMPGYETQYPMLLSEAELFLPIDGAVQISGMDALNQPVTIASSTALFDELRRLNAVTWQADESEIIAWQQQYNRVQPALVDGQLVINHAQERDRFEEVAKYGFSVLYQMCQFALEHQVAMRLDW